MAAGKNDEEILRFDVATDYSDHHYLTKNKPSGDCFTNESGSVYKRIMNEREILKKNLPENIIVRVYKQRIDLLRAVIVGAARTPCHDGLFFFDFAFPPDYPLRPPAFCFRTFAAKKQVVYVTLPDSWWGGNKYKSWNPSKSNVLQVLVDLQNQLQEWVVFIGHGDFLSEKPLIWKKTCMENNDDVFVLSCQRMLLLAQNPPKNFEGFVAGHFRKRGNVILKACKAYKNGDVTVGNYREEDEKYYDDGPSPKNNNAVIKVSAKFKTSIEKLYPLLFAAIAKHSISLKEMDTETAWSDTLAAAKVTERVKHGLTNKIISTMKMILGLRKKGNAKV